MDKKGPKGLQLGLVTYQWAKGLDLPTVISNCEKSGVLGVELRTQHAHKREINLNAAQRQKLRNALPTAPVTCVGYGSTMNFIVPDPAKLRENIDGAKEYVKAV